MSLLRPLLSNTRARPLEPGGRFLLLFALANAGGVIAYAPFLTLLLPDKVAILAGEERIGWLGAATLFGAIAASLGNIAFGWASDLWGSRRGWASAGLVFTVASYALLGQASSRTEIVAAIIIYQLSLNMLLAPLSAWAADVVPDSRKGVLGGLIAAGQPLGALAGILATLPMLDREWMRLATICLLVTLFVLPLLMAGRQGPPRSDDLPKKRSSRPKLDFTLAWMARLLMQTAGSVLFAFMLYYFFSLPQPPTQSDVARMSAAALILSFPVALLIGRLSDRIGPRRPFLVAAVAVAAAGLALMAAAGGPGEAIVGYMIFSSAAAVFASLHTGYSMQLLPSARRRGRDMGVLNLTNTFPGIIAPLLAIWLVPDHGFKMLLQVLCGFALAAGICILLIRHDSQRPA